MGNSVPILVIDDDRLLADYAKTILEECGFIVSLAGNGEEGVEGVGGDGGRPLRSVC